MTIGSILLVVFIAGLFVYVFWFAPVGWRTRIFNWVGFGVTGIWTAIPLVLHALDGVSFIGILDDTAAKIATLLILIGNAILREVTTTPPGTPK